MQLQIPTLYMETAKKYVPKFHVLNYKINPSVLSVHTILSTFDNRPYYQKIL